MLVAGTALGLLAASPSAVPGALAQGSPSYRLAQLGQPTQYTVFCTYGRIGVEMRTPQQMSQAFGSSTCQVSRGFTSLSDAQNFAQRQFGGVERSCSCN
jgi:hypothetical protein